MKLFIFSLLLLLLPLPVSAQTDEGKQSDAASAAMADTACCPPTDAEPAKRTLWQKFIPRQVILQYAGNMGLLSVGAGWDFGRRRQWETLLFLGFIPKYDADAAHLTMTLKENFVPWSVGLGRRLSFQPLTATVYLNTVFGHEFWTTQPSRYPKKYYEGLSTRFRFNIGLGQRLTLCRLPERWPLRSVSAFYEVSSCDLYIRDLIQGSGISLGDVLVLSLGLKCELP